MTAMTIPEVTHESVMLREVLAALNVQPGGRYVDCTLGGGGHAAAILQASSPGGTLLGIDADPDALAARPRPAGVLRRLRSPWCRAIFATSTPSAAPETSRR